MARAPRHNNIAAPRRIAPIADAQPGIPNPAFAAAAELANHHRNAADRLGNFANEGIRLRADIRAELILIRARIAAAREAQRLARLAPATPERADNKRKDPEPETDEEPSIL